MDAHYPLIQIHPWLLFFF